MRLAASGAIGADGVAAPEIIGIPIGPDTDRGRLDHDLTQPSNWIEAVNAYNSSVEYNNRVAKAATDRAALR